MSGLKHNRGRARGNTRGRGSTIGRGSPIASTSTPGLGISPPNDVKTIGVRRTGYGTNGFAISVATNHYAVKIPSGTIYHYDVQISPGRKLPVATAMRVISRLQEDIAPDVFTPRIVYDGRKSAFSSRELSFTDRTFEMTLQDQDADPLAQAGSPIVYKVRLCKIQDINLDLLSRFFGSTQSTDLSIQYAMTALDTVLKMDSRLRYPCDGHVYCSGQGSQDIGTGIVLWRGFFQRLRPVAGRLLLNVDITTGVMYKSGPLIEVCLDFLSTKTRRYVPQDLVPGRGLTKVDFERLQQFLKDARINTTNTDGQKSKTPKIIKKLSKVGADELFFTAHHSDGSSRQTVAEYFERTWNQPLKYPHLLCVELRTGALVPLEICTMPEGQIARKEIPEDKFEEILSFASKAPRQRVQSIHSALGVLAYGQSEYVRQFGLHVEEQDMVTVQARMLPSPGLKCGDKKTFKPDEGLWNMVDRKLYRPVKVLRWCIAVFEREVKFGQECISNVVKGFMSASRALGMKIGETDPIVEFMNPQGNIVKHLLELGRRVAQKHGRQGYPELVIVVLPENETELYRTVKYFGDILVGVATQCMKASRCSTGDSQYYNNICLKNPTIVMGADVLCPLPGILRSSYASLVASNDPDTTLYSADCRVQARSYSGRIVDLQPMVKTMLDRYAARHGSDGSVLINKAPKRIIFYRRVVSEKHFADIRDSELRQIQAACADAKINAKITFIAVHKGHHVRFFPQNETHGDLGGNCKAGLVVDRDVPTQPLEFEFYLQSHSGMLSQTEPARGTAQPVLYHVLHDDNEFGPDALQRFSYALCHVCARCTRSVSVPAPVYYAGLVCSRAKNHYTPTASAIMAQIEAETENYADYAHSGWFEEHFMPLHKNQRERMYFM